MEQPQPNLIRRAAGALGLTIGDLAKAIDTPPRTVYGWSSGEEQPRGAARVLLGLIAEGKVKAGDLRP
jgi:DNA-binding transcriptional regulator YiaG